MKCPPTWKEGGSSKILMWIRRARKFDVNCGGIPKLTQKTRVDLQNVVMKKGRVLFIHSCDSQSIKINWFHSIYTVYIVVLCIFNFFKMRLFDNYTKRKGGFLPQERGRCRKSWEGKGGGLENFRWTPPFFQGGNLNNERSLMDAFCYQMTKISHITRQLSVIASFSTYSKPKIRF